MEEGAEPGWALKLVQGILAPAAQREVADSFTNESRAAALLTDCQDITVPIVDHAQGEQPYILMPYVTWPTASAWLKRVRLTPLRVAQVGRALLNAVSRVHALDVVHCDLKPANIFIKETEGDPGFAVKISDFGLWVRDLDSTISTSMSASSLRGTVGYMSPEQMNGLPLGKRSDIHAVGSILWELITRAPPFVGEGPTLTDRIQARKALLKAPLRRPEEIPQGLYEILIKALAYEPKDRWDSTAEMARALEGFVEGHIYEARERLGATRARLRVLEETIAEIPQGTAEARAWWDGVEKISDQAMRLERALERRELGAFEAGFGLLECQINQLEIQLHIKEEPGLDVSLEGLEALPEAPAAARGRPWLWIGIVGIAAFGAGIVVGQQLQGAPAPALGAAGVGLCVEEEPTESPAAKPTPMEAPIAIAVDARPAEPVDAAVAPEPEIDQGAPEAPAAPEARPFSFEITTTPQGFPLFSAADNAKLGATPREFDFEGEAQPYKIYFKRDDGLKSYPVEVTFDAAENRARVNFDLRRWVRELDRMRKRQARRHTRKPKADESKPVKPKIGVVDESK